MNTDPGRSPQVAGEPSWEDLLSGAGRRTARNPRAEAAATPSADRPDGPDTDEVEVIDVDAVGRTPDLVVSVDEPAAADDTAPAVELEPAAARRGAHGRAAGAERNAGHDAEHDPGLDAERHPEHDTEHDPQNLHELEERIAHVLRSPEMLRSVHQPIVDLRAGECVGYEALVRVAEWPARSPLPWLDAAARAGLVAPLEAAALTASLRARLTMPGERFLAVNVSATSLTDPAVRRVFDEEDDLARLLVTPGPATDLTARETRAALAALRERGATIAVTLHEAGRSELAAVAAVRPGVVALDRAFGLDLHTDPVRRRLVATVVDFTADLGGTVLAEGIEAVADARSLRDLGVRLGQGWLFGRARPGFAPPSTGAIAALGPQQDEDADVDAGRDERPGQPAPRPAPRPGPVPAPRAAPISPPSAPTPAGPARPSRFPSGLPVPRQRGPVAPGPGPDPDSGPWGSESPVSP